jgi:hypothetical protein
MGAMAGMGPGMPDHFGLMAPQSRIPADGMDEELERNWYGSLP